MAIARDVSSSDVGGSGLTSLTWSHTCSGADRLLRVSAFIDGGSSSEVISGITYPKGGTPTALTFVSKLQRASPDSNAWTYIYEMIAPDTGTHDIVVSTSGSAYIGLSIGRSYTGASATQPHNHNEGSQHSAGTSISTSVTTTVDNSWVEAYGYGDNGGIGVGTGMTIFTSVASAAICGDSNGVITPAGSYTIGITASNGNLGVMACDIAPATGTAYTLSAIAGAFALTGVAVGLAIGYLAAAAAGAFALTGVDVILKKGYGFAASVGTFALSGVAATLAAALHLAASVGSFILTGIAAAFPRVYAIGIIRGVSADSGTVVGSIRGDGRGTALDIGITTGTSVR